MDVAVDGAGFLYNARLSIMLDTSGAIVYNIKADDRFLSEYLMKNRGNSCAVISENMISSCTAQDFVLEDLF